MASIDPFSINVAEERLQRLKRKLSLANIPEDNDCEPWVQGPPAADIERLVKHWASDFDWRKVESELNKFPQYTTLVNIPDFGDYRVHFIHQRSSTETAIPLLFLHGWPGSFIEVTRILPDLVKGGDNAPSFHVVAPSLIDFGFSAASKKKGFNMDQQAEAVHNVMVNLGYNEYVVHGGDLGSMTARFLCHKYGIKHVKAHHVNNTLPGEPQKDKHPELCKKVKENELDAGELEGLSRTAKFWKEGDGYIRQQSTKPQTLGYSLQDSPVGLLAWLYEKLHDWADDYSWTDDEILTWASIYYFSTAGPAASSYIYWNMTNSDPPNMVASGAWSDVPLGISRFQNDNILLPKLWNHTLGPIVFSNEHKNGGHFAAYERPDAIVADLRKMFGKNGGAYGVVPGKNGY